jgi:hypothetical protein
MKALRANKIMAQRQQTRQKPRMPQSENKEVEKNLCIMEALSANKNIENVKNVYDKQDKLGVGD